MTTVDPTLKSFIEVHPDSHFPIQNLPYGAFRRNPDSATHIGVAIGDQILDLTALSQSGLLDTPLLAGRNYFGRGTLNFLMAAGKAVWTEARETISALLQADNPLLRDDETLRRAAFLHQDAVAMQMPVDIGHYSDFYSSREHATNVGSMFRDPQNALLPNWTWIPIAYHGRASSVVISGTDIRRPVGQTRPDPEKPPVFGPCRLLDFELEMGFFVGPGTEMGQSIPLEQAIDHIFGMVLVNDWSARDIQRWEYQPLGPFLSKNFATSISPWVVPMAALEPFRMAGPTQNPEPLPYLRGETRRAYDIRLSVTLRGEGMAAPATISNSNLRHMYWNICQQLTHHSISGCNMNPGDLLASGTISGPTPDSYGSLLELAWRGTKPLEIAPGETRSFLQDGDTLALSGYCQGDGFRVGFGEVSGRILPAVQ